MAGGVRGRGWVEELDGAGGGILGREKERKGVCGKNKEEEKTGEGGGGAGDEIGRVG